MTTDITSYNTLIKNLHALVEASRDTAYKAVNSAMLDMYWNIGKRIVGEEQKGDQRAEYGKKLLKTLSDDLTANYGKGFSDRSLRYYRKFYLMFPDREIWNTCVPNLTWSHFRALLRVDDENARIWYMPEAYESGRSTRTLDRNISTQYYYRLLQSPKKDAVIAEMKEKTAGLQNKQYELIKSPVVAEFLGFKDEDTYLESDLESAILSHIRDFLMEMGRGFAFVARQQHIVTETDDFYIDLVFYNIELKCYVLIDLKMGKITHQDVEQGDILNVMSGTTLYGKEICVPKEEVDRARELMKEYDSAGTQDDPKDKPKVRIPYLILAIVFVVAVIFAMVYD